MGFYNELLYVCVITEDKFNKIPKGLKLLHLKGKYSEFKLGIIKNFEQYIDMPIIIYDNKIIKVKFTNNNYENDIILGEIFKKYKNCDDLAKDNKFHIIYEPIEEYDDFEKIYIISSMITSDNISYTIYKIIDMCYIIEDRLKYIEHNTK